MLRQKSLIYPAILLLLLAIGATLGVGYFINYSLLRDVLKERVASEAGQVTAVIQKDIGARIAHMESFKDSWLNDMAGLAAGEPEPPGVAAQAKSDLPWENLAQFFPYWKLDHLLVISREGKLLRHLPTALAASGLPQELTATALEKTADGSHFTAAGRIGDTWSIQLFAPLPGAGDAGRGAPMAAFGYRLEAIIAKLKRDHPERRFVLATGESRIGAADPDAAPGGVNQSLAAQAIREGRALIDFDPDEAWNLHYSPIRILNADFALVTPVSLAPVRSILAGSRERLAWSALFMAGVLAIMGLLMNALMLAPLRKLHKKATALVAVCSTDDDDRDAAPGQTGDDNEIRVLEQALQAASLKLYVHLQEMQESHFLLEGLALRDPMTEFLNQRMFMELLNRELMEAKRKERLVAVVLMELSGHDALVEEMGSETGEALWKEAARRLEECFRGEDLIFRLDDHSFGAFLPECGDKEHALIVAKRIHEAIDVEFELPDGSHAVAIHLGLSMYPEHGATLEELVEVSATALERAKREEVPYRFPGDA